MRTLLLIILFSISLNSQWVYDVGYSVSKEKFENSEWRIYEGELQVHRNDSSYFYNIENLKLYDKLKVDEDVFIYPGYSEYQRENASFEVIANKFDKITVKILGSTAYIFDEKSQDTIKTINLLKYLSINTNRYADLYLYDSYRIITTKDNIFIYNSPLQGIWDDNVHSYRFYSYNSLIRYNFEKDTILKSTSLNGIAYHPYYIFDIYDNNYGNPHFLFYNNSKTDNLGFKVFYPLNDALINISSHSVPPSNNSFINKSFEYLTSYNNYTFNSREIKNWENQTIDTNIRKYKARLIQELIPNTYLMYSDSINYFIYNLIDNNLVVLDKINDIHKKEQFTNEYVDEEKSLFYAETASHKIARVSISSIVNNLISVDFSADKNMADSNYVFTFENKSVGEIDKYLWDFGDGNTSTEKNPKHKYDSSGTYDITLTCSGAGQSTSNTKKGHIYIPTPVRLNITQSMIRNEKDATFYVSSGATGSRLQQRMYVTLYPEVSLAPESMIEVSASSAYSFSTNKALFTKTVLFEVWNEMYSVSKSIYYTYIEFDFWNKDVLNEKIIGYYNFYYLNNNKVDKAILLENDNNDPIVVSSINNSFLEIKNLKNDPKSIILNNKTFAYNTNKYFITNDNYYYSFSIINDINKIDSINLNNYISDNKIIFYDYYDENSFLMMSKDSIYIFNNSGIFLDKLKNPSTKIPAFFRKFGKEYYLGEVEGTTSDKFTKIVRYDENFDLLNQYTVISNKISPTKMKSEVNLRNDTLFINRFSDTDLHRHRLDLNTKIIYSEYNNNKNRQYSNIANNKYLTLEYVSFVGIFVGYYDHIYSTLSIVDIEDLNIIYEYTFTERMGEIKAANLINGYVYLYGNFKNSNGYKNTLLKLDLKDEMYLDVEEAKLSENKYIWDRFLKINTTSNYNTDYKLFNLLGEEIDKANYRLSINKDNIELEAINIAKGVYKLQIGEQNFILLK